MLFSVSTYFLHAIELAWRHFVVGPLPGIQTRRTLFTGRRIGQIVAIVLVIKAVPGQKQSLKFQLYGVIDSAQGNKNSYARLAALQVLPRFLQPLRSVLSPPMFNVVNSNPRSAGIHAHCHTPRDDVLDEETVHVRFQSVPRLVRVCAASYVGSHARRLLNCVMRFLSHLGHLFEQPYNPNKAGFRLIIPRDH